MIDIMIKVVLEMSQCFFSVQVLLCFITTVKCVVYHLLSAQSDTCNIDCHECLTLSQFASNSSNYLTNDTMLIFAPGSHTMELELIVDNIHSFSMLAETTPLMETKIICYDHAKFTFSNISVVTVSGFKFSECKGNQVLSVCEFRLEISAFYGSINHLECSAILAMVETSSYLERVYFTFHFIEQQAQNHTVPKELPDICYNRRVILHADASILTITQSWFAGNHWRVLYSNHSSVISILSSIFVGNTRYGGILYAEGWSTVNIHYCTFKHNRAVLYAFEAFVIINHSAFFLNTPIRYMLNVWYTSLKVSHTEFVDSYATILYIIKSNISIDHCRFIKNTAWLNLIDLRFLVAKNQTINHNEFKNNKVAYGIVSLYNSIGVTITNNEFVDNNAAFDIYISSECEWGSSISLGSSRCIQCPKHWRQHLIGIIIAAFIAGLALVFIVFAFNMTIAVGTLNGILLYGHIIAANADTYFLPFSSPNFATVFISWLNLDVGFDVCFFEDMDGSDKAQIQLAFPVYIILLVITVIIVSECSTKFASMIGKGNPIAVLTTMILISYTKFLNAVIGSFSLLYLKPAYGSRNLDIMKFDQLQQINTYTIERKHYSLLIFAPIILLLGILYAILVFSWQWLLLYQDKPIFKWVKYQKLHHFMEPHHAPYTSKHRYWTGLLLLVRIALFSEGVLNFSKDPQIDLLATVIVVSYLLLLKSVSAKRVYKNWLVDIMETAICFNLIILAVLTMYCLKPGAQISQSAITYISVAITFILFLMVVIFHALRYTRLYNYPFVQKLFMKLSSKLSDREVKQETENNNNMPEELDGYQLERAVDPVVTHTVMELQKPLLN